MSGRITYWHPEIHKDGGWTPPIALTQKAKAKIGELIGRELTCLEIASICKNIADIQFMRTGFKDPLNQDIKRTLASFSKCSLLDAVIQYRKSDATTQALIDEALGCDLKLVGTDLLSPSGESIKQAAEIAKKNLQPGRSGARKEWHLRMLATYTLNLWEDLGMKSCQPWHHQDFEPPASPIVLLMKELKIVIDEKSIDSKDAVRLLKEAKIKR